MSLDHFRLVDLPEEILSKIFCILKVSREQYNINEKIPIVFNKTNLVIDFDLISLSQTCRKFRYLLIGHIYNFVSFFRKEETDLVRQCTSYCLEWNKKILNDQEKYWSSFFNEVFSNVSCLEVSIGQWIRIWKDYLSDEENIYLHFGDNLKALKLFSIENEKEINGELMKIVDEHESVNLKIPQNLKLRSLLISINGLNSELIYNFITKCSFLNDRSQFSKLERLDILIDGETEYFQQIMNLFTRNLEKNCENLKQMNLISKNFKMLMLQKDINELISITGQNLEVLGFTNSKNRIDHTIKIKVNSGANLIDFDTFGNSVSKLNKLRHIIIEISILENFKTPAIEKINKRKFKPNGSQNFDLTIDLIEGSSYDFTNFVNKSPNSLRNFLTYFFENDEIEDGGGLQKNVRVILNYVRQVESLSFKHEMVLMKTLISNTVNSNFGDRNEIQDDPFDVKSVVLNWAWSLSDEFLIHSYNLKLTNENEQKQHIVRIQVPSYARIDFCNPEFRQIEAFNVVRNNHARNQEVEFERIDTNKENVNENEEFWSFDVCKSDLQKYSEPLVKSSIWD